MLRDIYYEQDLVEMDPDDTSQPYIAFRTRTDGQPASGLLVETYENGTLRCVSELEDGFFNGYSVEYRPDATIVEVAQMYRQREHGLQARFDLRGELADAARIEVEVTTDRLERDSASGEMVQTRREGADESLKDVYSYKYSSEYPKLPERITDLLAVFDGKGEALYREAQLGLSLNRRAPG